VKVVNMATDLEENLARRTMKASKREASFFVTMR
jgi:hypothetical protein